MKAARFRFLLLIQTALSVATRCQTPPVVEFTATAVTGTEGGAAHVVVTCKPPAENVRVTVTAADGTARQLSDYWSPSLDHTLSFSDGQATVDVGLIDDEVPEEDETFTLTLHDPTGGAVLGQRTHCLVTIKNLGAHVYLEASELEVIDPVAEGESFSVRVLRMGDLFVPFSVTYGVLGGTAREGSDFKAFSGVLNFASGQKAQLLTLPTLDNGLVDKVDAKSIRIGLLNATGAHLGLPLPRYATPQLDATFWITDNESPANNPDLTFSPAVQGTLYAVQSDGKILVGNSNCSLVGGCSPLRRLDPDGSLDTSYQPQFVMKAPDLANWNPGVRDFQILADNAAVVFGDFISVNGVKRPGLVRLRPDGSVDESFNPDTDLPVRPDLHLVPLRSGRLLVRMPGSAKVILLLANGKEDSSFRFPDFVTNGILNSVMEDSQARLVVNGSFSENSTNQLVRLRPDGTLDSSFKPRFELSRPAVSVSIGQDLLQADDKVLVTGGYEYLEATSNEIVFERFLIRLNPDGSTDPMFRAAPEIHGRLGAMVIQPDGRILVQTDLNKECRIRRINPDGTVDLSFTPVVCEPRNWDAGPLSALFHGVSENALILSGVRGLNGVPVGLARLRLEGGPRSALAAWPDGSALEGGGPAVFTLRRLGDSATSARVSFATRDGSAKAGRDYTAMWGVVEFGPLELTKTVSVPVLNNNVLEASRAFELVLNNAVGFEAISPPQAASIYDDEVGFLPAGIQWLRDSNTHQLHPFLQWNSTFARNSSLEVSSDLKSWRPAEGTPANNGVVAWQLVAPDPMVSSSRFYRVRLPKP